MNRHQGLARAKRVSGRFLATVIATAAAYESSAALAPRLSSAIGSLTGVRLFVDGTSAARQQADAWRKSRPSDARLMSYIASQPMARWIGGWTSDVRQDVSDFASRAASQGTTPVFVAYNIPSRDCGNYSAGGAQDASRYASWIRSFADGLAGRRAVVILEPDALGQVDCLKPDQQAARYRMLNDAVHTLKRAGGVVYIDAGNAHWVAADLMASRLRQAGIDAADGFALNVSNYFSTSDNVRFGNDLSRRVGGKHYVIDTSRNGMGGGNGWCNASGQALGAAPTTNTGVPLADAFLWIKHPGESDGTCNGGPKAGAWWPEYALGLAQRQFGASN